MSAKPKETTYAEASQRLAEILAQLREGSVGIDDLAAVVEEAAQLLQHCRSKLRAVELKVEKIAKDLEDDAPEGDDPFG